ncbi:MAG TPA: hypothetical protein VEA18_00780 [Candidatus Kapabacteria bacterium]|nr:hypothetical protein [Candidatus Kapabacteria bacterium]
MWILVFQRMALEFILDFLYFPLWWYSGGIVFMFHVAGGMLKTGNSLFAPGLWLQNLFVPMFGQHDWQGRIVSFFVRFMNVIARSIALIIWFCIVVLVCLVWIAFPIMVVFLLFLSLV